MLKVKDLDSSTLPKAFIDVLPKTCDICGEDTEITESLTMLCCPNPRCLAKVTQRLLALLNDLGIKNMGESRCEKFLRHFGVTNPYAIFMYELSDGTLFDGCGMEFSESIFDQVDAKRDMLLWEFIKIGNLPGIRDSARHLFMDYEDLEEFYDDLEAGGIPFVQDRLGIVGKKAKVDKDGFYDDDDDSEPVSVKAISIYDTLLEFKQDLFDALPFVNIISVNKFINICISTAVGAPYKSKADFVQQMNAKFSDKVHLNFLGSVTKDCEYLIWSKEGAPTNKVQKANKYGIPILTGTEFESLLESM